MTTYLLVNVLTVFIPAIFTFHPRIRFHTKWPALWPAMSITAVAFISWDVIFTRSGIWGFNPDYILGVSLLSLPLEEWLFFFCIPYACVFTYESLKMAVPERSGIRPSTLVTIVLLFGLLILGILFIDRSYTAMTAFSTALFLLLHIAKFRFTLFPRFFVAYLAIFLFPFLIVNGILTGSFLGRQVVWYNNAENLGIRVLTIPVEDFVYGFLLFLMNVTLYEWFLRIRSRRQA